jgi:predicted O-linked N-acetylglucosamine transferase (SPINDLY family)
VDLAGHTAGNRLQVFTTRPAPVQASYLGYPNTTGLAAMDYRLSDARADPPGEGDHLYSETLVRLPEGFLCYRPPGDAPPVRPAPVEKNGHITFGSFNNLAKMTPEVITTWAAILQRLPGSRLLLKTRAFADAGARECYRAQLQQAGIAAERIELRKPADTIGEHLAAYGEIDIALDTFPYNGTTTTCEALWMGVPVITLAGRLHAGRVGVSLLTQVRRTAWIAQGPGEYIEHAATLAGELQQNPAPRPALREAMARSPLCDAPGFCCHVEQAYREMWASWCRKHAA